MAPVPFALQGGALVSGSPDGADGRQTLFPLTEIFSEIAEGPHGTPGLANAHGPGSMVAARREEVGRR